MKGKRSPRQALSYLAVVPPAAAIALAILMLLSGCGGGSTIAVPTDEDPAAGKLLPVHVFEYDTDAREYKITWGTSGVVTMVARDDVDRDMVGSLCGRCHADKIDEVKDTMHYRLQGRTPRVMYPGGGAHGMLDRACGLPSTTGLTNSVGDVNLGECAKCHVNRYLPVMEGMFTNMFTQMGVPNAADQAQTIVESGIDCLICHAHDYSAHPRDGVIAELAKTASEDGHSPSRTGFAREAHDNSDFNHDGAPDPQIDMDGDGVVDTPLMIDTDGDGTPDSPWRTVAQDRSPEAMATIGKTTEHACLRCHDHARTGYKRGVLFAEGHDVHATLTTGVFEGVENRCTVCHASSHHKFARGHSVGGDLGASDYPVPAPGTPIDPEDPTDVSCMKCHDPATLPEPAIHSARHLGAMSCEMCHIPYASGITYSLFGHGGHVSLGRNPEGKDTQVIAADNYLLGDLADQTADWEAHKTRPIYVWFNGGTSFLAQTLSVRGMPNAKITPFKPMANGMVFDARYFDGVTLKNAAGFDYNAHSMYRFFANGFNAEAFFALDMLDMSPDAVRNVTLDDFFNPDPGVQTMAMMQIFPNLVYFDKGRYGFEHYMCGTDSPFDLDTDGIVDVDANLYCDMLEAANSGLRQFQGFNGPMGFPPEYEWYPPYASPDQTISMKLPDGSLMKMFLQMQAGQLPEEQQGPFLNAVANYPSFSQVTLGGHGVRPKAQALGANNGCMDCHGADGAMAHTVPVGRKFAMDMGPMMGTLEMPIYAWKFYKVSDIVQLGLTATSEEIVAGTKNLDIDGNANVLRASAHEFAINWFMPSMPGGFVSADAAEVLAGTSLEASDLTWNGGAWMPVLEPVTDLVPNYAVLGYERSELIWGE